MEILVVGGTRFFGIHMVNDLIARGHNVTIATRGQAKDSFGNSVKRIILDRADGESVKAALKGKTFDVVYDKVAYCSNDVRYLLDNMECKRYICMSTASVYETLHENTVEEEFNPLNKELMWCDRADFDYGEVKRQMECAIYQKYKDIESTAVRYPFVIGEDDYTKRLLFYVDHVMKEIPMNVDNLENPLGFIDSVEAGRFMAFLAENPFKGAINGCLGGAVSMGEVINYVEKNTGKKAVLRADGDEAPYNGAPMYTINTDKAEKLGYKFPDIKDKIYDLLDYYIKTLR